MATSAPGDDVAKWSGWRMVLTAVFLIVGAILGSLTAAMALYGYRYNLVIGAVIFETGLAVANIFCAGRLGRGYYPLHPCIRAQLARLFVLHVAAVALVVIGGILVINFSTLLGSWWVTDSGPKHDSPLSFLAIVLLVVITFSEVFIARSWLQKAVSRDRSETSRS